VWTNIYEPNKSSKKKKGGGGTCGGGIFSLVKGALNCSMEGEEIRINLQPKRKKEHSDTKPGGKKREGGKRKVQIFWGGTQKRSFMRKRGGSVFINGKGKPREKNPPGKDHYSPRKKKKKPRQLRFLLKKKKKVFTLSLEKEAPPEKIPPLYMAGGEGVKLPLVTMAGRERVPKSWGLLFRRKRKDGPLPPLRF